MTDATLDELQSICRILHSRGREATPDDVLAWCAKVRNQLVLLGRDSASDGQLCRAIIAGNKSLTMCLHLHFGDALE